MKHLLLALTLVALVAALASAQDGEKPKAENLERRLRDLAVKLASDDPAVREKAFEEFRRLAAANSTAKAGGPMGLTVFDDAAKVVLDMQSTAGKEKIEGKWTKDGTKGSYTLESLGKGQYKLTARSVNPEGTEARYTDEGPMAELRKKYPFLKNFGGMLFIGPGRVEGAVKDAKLFISNWPSGAGTFSMTTVASPKLIQSLGVLVRRPSKELEFHLKLPTETTWIIESVTPRTKGEQLGLKRYDLITAADGEDLTELAPLAKAVKSLEIVRRSKPIRIALPSKEDK